MQEEAGLAMAGSTKESQAAGSSVLGQGVVLGGRGGGVWERGWMWGKENEKTWDGVIAPRIMILLDVPQVPPWESLPLFPLRGVEI